MKKLTIPIFLSLLTFISCDFSGRVIFEETIYGEWKGTNNYISNGTDFHFNQNGEYIRASYKEDENGKFLGYTQVNFGSYIVNENEIIFSSSVGDKGYYTNQGEYVSTIDDLKSQNVAISEQDYSSKLNAEFVKNYRTLRLSVPCGPNENCFGIPVLKKVN